MNQKLLPVVSGAALCVLVSAGTAAAALIEFVPAVPAVFLGDGLEVDVRISGLGDFTSPSLGVFDLDVSFDPTILAPTAVTFGAFLGDPSLFEADTFAALLTGLLDFFELSFLLDDELDAVQPDSFVLATLSFDAVGLGTSSLVFSDVILGDAFGDPLSSVTSTGSVTVTAIPVPATAWLLLPGLLGVFLRTRVRRLGCLRRAQRE